MKGDFTRRCVCLVTLAACLSGAAYAQTAPRSYYVRADGDDANNGRSEAAPFKTLGKAVEAAKMGAIKTITLIGPIEGGSGWDNSVSIEATGNDEILITGKPDAGSAEKAVIKRSININSAKGVRFTHIRLEGGMIIGEEGAVILGEGVVATGSSLYGSAIYLSYSSRLTMTGDAHITGNTSGSGVGGDSVAAIIMSGNAKITGNAGAGVGIVNSSSAVTMSDNAEISGNKGGGICAGTVTLSGNASITGNTAERGGGVYIYGGSLTLSDNASITGNIAGKEGGGVYVVSNSSLTLSGNASITGNTAKKGGGAYAGYVDQEGGTISGNKAEYGAGVYIENGRRFTHKGGTVTGNEAEFVGGGVYVEAGGTYNAQGGSVTGNTAGDGDGEDVFRQ